MPSLVILCCKDFPVLGQLKIVVHSDEICEEVFLASQQTETTFPTEFKASCFKFMETLGCPGTQ